jgi:hypothetical protein
VCQVDLPRISGEPFIEITKRRKITEIMMQENLKFWRLQVLYLFNMMHYPFIAKAVPETIAKPSYAV